MQQSNVAQMYNSKDEFYESVAKEYDLDMTPSHQAYYDLIKKSTLTVGYGPAGTGKTLIAAKVALELLKAKKIERIVLSRPVVEAGEKIGSLPGDIDDKFGPYFEPFEDALYELEGVQAIRELVDNGIIVAKPLAYLRGKSFHNAFVILDEGQNATVKQIKLFMTRLGRASKAVITGDTNQVDIKPSMSGLADVIGRIRNVNNVGVHQFTIDDVKRCPFVKDILATYEEEKIVIDIPGKE